MAGEHGGRTGKRNPPGQGSDRRIGRRRGTAAASRNERRSGGAVAAGRLSAPSPARPIRRAGGRQGGGLRFDFDRVEIDRGGASGQTRTGGDVTGEGMPEWARQMEGRSEAGIEANKSQTLLDVTGIIDGFRKEMRADRRWTWGLIVFTGLALAGLILA